MIEKVAYHKKSFAENFLKAQVIELIRVEKLKYNVHVVDNMVKKRRRIVLRVSLLASLK